MSQNPDETRDSEPGGAEGRDREFESGLDYGAFASEEPDFPEDRLEKEPTPSPSDNDDDGSASPSASTEPAAAPPADAGEQPTTAVPPQDDSATRSLSEELAAARSASSADKVDAAQAASADAPASAQEQPTTVVPPAEQAAPAGQAAAGPAAAGAAGVGVGTTSGTTPARAPATGTAASPAKHAASNEEITEADIEEEVTKSKRGISRFLTVLIAIFTPVLFVVAAIRLVGTPVFLWVTYQRPGFPDDAHGFTLEDRMLYGSYGMDFLFNLANYRYLADLTGPEGEPLFTSSGDDLNEVAHMVDVKQLVWIAMLVGLGLLVLTLIFALLLRSWRPGGFARGVFAGAWGTIALMIAAAVLAFLDWQRFFTEFHTVFFSGNWAFPDDYTLIRLYPTQFWIDAGIWIAALVLLFSLVALLVTWPTKRRRARRADRLAEVHQRRREKLIEELNSSAAS